MERYARFAGTWYPDDPGRLRRLVDTEMEYGNAIMGILPHAGLAYSGPLIRTFFARLSPRVRRILLISPSHYFYIRPDDLISSSFTSSATPLGSIATIPVDIGGISDRCIQAEHGVEMFLPYIAARGGLSVSYLMISSLSSYQNAERIAESILRHIDEGTAIIASSDFTHYGRSYGYMPYGDDGYDKVAEHDDTIAGLLACNKAEEALEAAEGGTICGIAPAVITATIARMRGLAGHVGNHATSADMNGDRRDFVSYRTILWEG